MRKIGILFICCILSLLVFAEPQEEDTAKTIKELSSFISKKKVTLKSTLQEMDGLKKRYNRIQRDLKKQKKAYNNLQKVSKLKSKDLKIYNYNLGKIDKNKKVNQVFVDTLEDLLKKIEIANQQLIMEELGNNTSPSTSPEKILCDHYYAVKLKAKKEYIQTFLTDIKKKQQELNNEEEKIKYWLNASTNIKERKDSAKQSIRKKMRSLEEVRKELAKKIAEKKKYQQKLEVMIQEKKQTQEILIQALKKQNVGGIARKGRLMWPAQGDIIEGFRYNSKKPLDSKNNSGINIAGLLGQKVRASANGVVIYADWFQGFGNLIMIDHGKKIYTLYAHLKDIKVKKGDAITMGHIIGTVGDTGSLKGPMLHFELRVKSIPQNPMEWLLPN